MKANKIVTFRRVIRKSHLTTTPVTEFSIVHPHRQMCNFAKWQAVSAMSLLISLSIMRLSSCNDTVTGTQRHTY